MTEFEFFELVPLCLDRSKLFNTHRGARYLNSELFSFALSQAIFFVSGRISIHQRKPLNANLKKKLSMMCDCGFKIQKKSNRFKYHSKNRECSLKYSDDSFVTINTFDMNMNMSATVVMQFSGKLKFLFISEYYWFWSSHYDVWAQNNFEQDEINCNVQQPKLIERVKGVRSKNKHMRMEISKISKWNFYCTSKWINCFEYLSPPHVCVPTDLTAAHLPTEITHFSLFTLFACFFYSSSFLIYLTLPVQRCVFFCCCWRTLVFYSVFFSSTGQYLNYSFQIILCTSRLRAFFYGRRCCRNGSCVLVFAWCWFFWQSFENEKT